MIKMPIKFKINDKIIKWLVLILEKPIIAKPISSGNGEAITIAPKTDKSHLNLKRCNWKNTCHHFFRLTLKNLIKSSVKLFLIKRKITKSPTTAPKAAKKEIATKELACINLIKITTAGATVKIEMKNIPAKKALKNLNSSLSVTIFSIVSLWTKTIATNTLMTTIAKSRNKLL